MGFLSSTSTTDFTWKNLPIPSMKGLICSYGVLNAYTKEAILKLYNTYFNVSDYEIFGELEMKIIDYRETDVVYLIKWRKNTNEQYIMIFGSEL